jgi:hypothetical protein
MVVVPQPRPQNQAIFDAIKSNETKTSGDQQHWSRTGPETRHQGSLSEASGDCDTGSSTTGEKEVVPGTDLANACEE